MYIIKRDHAIPYFNGRSMRYELIVSWSSRLDDSYKHQFWLGAYLDAKLLQIRLNDKTIRVGNASDGSDASMNFKESN